MNRNTALIAVFLVLATTVPLGFAQGGERTPAVVDRYQLAREKYKNNVQAYREARSDFISARQKIAVRRNASDGEVRLKWAKTFLLRSTEAMTSHLEVVKTRIEVSRALPDDEKKTVVAEIQSYITWLENVKGDIESAESKEDLLSTAREIREKWLESRVSVKKITGKVLTARLDSIIGKGEGVSDRVDARIEDLKEAGKDTSKLEELLDVYNSKIELAKEKSEAAKAKFAEIDSLEDADKLFREGHQFLKDANRYLREAYGGLKDIVREMRRLNSEE